MGGTGNGSRGDRAGGGRVITLPCRRCGRATDVPMEPAGFSVVCLWCAEDDEKRMAEAERFNRLLKRRA